MGTDVPELKIGTVNDGLYLHVQGRATQRICPTADSVLGASSPMP